MALPSQGCGRHISTYHREQAFNFTHGSPLLHVFFSLYNWLFTGLSLDLDIFCRRGRYQALAFSPHTQTHQHKRTDKSTRGLSVHYQLFSRGTPVASGGRCVTRVIRPPQQAGLHWINPDAVTPTLAAHSHLVSSPGYNPQQIPLDTDMVTVVAQIPADCSYQWRLAEWPGLEPLLR